jgi:hypothetical protein
MNAKRSLLGLVIVFIAAVQLACSALANPTPPDTFSTLNALYTASALTLTATSALPAVTVTPGLPPPTATGTVQPVTTSSAGQSSPASSCDAAQFVKDITYADGSMVTRGTSFVKIWRIKNSGTCSWTTAYELIFTGGDLMGGPLSVALTKTVNPGETVDLQVALTAPNKDGEYRGYWKLRNAAGELFGVGEQSDNPFWVAVHATGPSYIAYEFASNYCDAVWENASDPLPCPGTQGAASGFVIKLNNPVMENGFVEDEPGLLVFPQAIVNGVTSGEYPPFTVLAGDRFRALVGCQDNSAKCDVVFRLDYKIGGQVKTLGSWQEIYEGLYYPIDFDLNSLADKTVQFILVVSANGKNDQDNAIWINPHIIREGAPTFTPTVTGTSTATAP